MFYKLADLIPKSILRSSAADSLQAAYILRLWPQVARRVFGAKYNSKVKAISLKSGKLWVLVPSQVWASEVRLQNQALIKAFSAILGKKVIQSIGTKLVN